MNKFAALTLSLFLVCGTALADTPKDPDAPAAKPKPAATAKPAEKTSAEIAAELETAERLAREQRERAARLAAKLRELGVDPDTV